MFPLLQILPEPTHFPTHPTLHSLFCSLLLALTLSKQIKNNNKQKSNKTKELPTINQPNMASILCWPTPPGQGTCPGTWLK